MMATDNRRWITIAAATLTAALWTHQGQAAQATVTQRLDPSRISLGEAARLTIAASGSDVPAIRPPSVAGLEFVPVGQSQQVQSINGVTTSTTSVTYQVIPTQAGVFTIPGTAPGAQPIVLTVGRGNGAAVPSPSARTAPGTASTPVDAAPLTAESAAFVRLQVPKHDLYVGETIPVDIEVGMREGIVASLNGPPTLNGDAFTLDKLSNQPQRVQEVIDGQPYTVLSWHSILAAVKPGTLSLSMETPITVRIRSPARADKMFADMGMDAFINDPNFQNFFGTSTEKDITVASKPTEFKILELPANERPADFSGAIGQFTVKSELSEQNASAGDPVTLRLRVSGVGNFDRVNTRMLHDVEHWKTYGPTSTFKSDNDTGERGVKTFEQPIIATQPGTQLVPPLSFSWFDPTTHRYVIEHTPALALNVTPGLAVPNNTAQADLGRAAATGATPGAPPKAGGRVKSSSTNGAASTPEGLRADHVETGGNVDSLMPHYFRAGHIAVPVALVVIVSSALFWLRRRETLATRRLQDIPISQRIAISLRQMDEGSAANDPEVFFKSARAALRNSLASKWRMASDDITMDVIDTYLGADSEIGRVFKLADESAYSGIAPGAIDFQRWKGLVLRELDREAMNG